MSTVARQKFTPYGKEYLKKEFELFFADNQATYQYFQRSQQTKLEMRFMNPFNQKSVSVASLNNHTGHFGKSFNIIFEKGEFVNTGCVGFGFERFVFCLFAQFGLDMAIWPESLREWLDIE